MTQKKWLPWCLLLLGCGTDSTFLDHCIVDSDCHGSLRCLVAPDTFFATRHCTARCGDADLDRDCGALARRAFDGVERRSSTCREIDIGREQCVQLCGETADSPESSCPEHSVCGPRGYCAPFEP